MEEKSRGAVEAEVDDVVLFDPKASTLGHVPALGEEGHLQQRSIWVSQAVKSDEIVRGEESQCVRGGRVPGHLQKDQQVVAEKQRLCNRDVPRKIENKLGIVWNQN